MRSTILLLILATLTGCASIVSNSTYPVTFDSNPTGAYITISDENGNMIYKGSAPMTLTLDASDVISDGFFDPSTYDVEASLAGHNPGRTSISAGLDGWYIGNILFGGLIGFLIVDPLTGAMWRLDNRVIVNLGVSSNGAGGSAEGAPATAAGGGRQLHILTLSDVPLHVREHMVPVHYFP